MSANAKQYYFQQPVIRHLSWLCSAPQLYRGDLTFDPANWLPCDYVERLHFWDVHPESMPELLKQPLPRRLGHYFEQLYACLLTDLLGWTLLVRNLQIRDQQRTLGELDFLVINPHTGAAEHHEIAVKFYLGHVDAGTGRDYWYGPNSRDRLDLKTDRLLNHQSRLTAQPATQAMLKSLGLDAPPVSRLFMPGYLFYHYLGETSPPAQADPGHYFGQWCHVSEAAMLPGSGWVALHKPHWLGNWQQMQPPEAGGLAQMVNGVRDSGRAALLARLRLDGDCWCENERMFVLPDTWPGIPSQG